MSGQGGVKFPYLIESRRILWYEVMCWGYFWGMTESQVDLLLADQPVVNYKRDKKKKSGARGKNGVREMSKPADWKVSRAASEWEKKYGGEKKEGESKKIKFDFTGFK